MGSVGAARVGGGGNDITKSPEYTESYNFEIDRIYSESPVPSALHGRSDDWIEGEMIRYRSAIGDPIRAMQRVRDAEARTLVDYEEARSASNLGTRDALREMVKKYDEAIEHMRRIKTSSSRKDMM